MLTGDAAFWGGWESIPKQRRGGAGAGPTAILGSQPTNKAAQPYSEVLTSASAAVSRHAAHPVPLGRLLHLPGFHGIAAVAA